ncbi:MAG: hypothetical protein U0821_13435 [Chloroflexota bacterium]
MAEQASQAVAQGKAAPEITRVRDIILGPQTRENETRFKAVQHDIQRLQQGIDRLTEQLAELDAEQGKKLQAVRRELRENQDDIRSELRESAAKLANDKVDRLALGELLIELGTLLKDGGTLSGALVAVDKAAP